MKQSFMKQLVGKNKTYLSVKEGAQGISTFVDDKIYEILEEHKQQLVTFLSNVIIRLDPSLIVARHQVEADDRQDIDKGSK